MRPTKRLLAIGLAAMALNMQAQQTFDLDLWQGKPRVQSTDRQDTARVRVFLPAQKSATGRAVVICPGGAYEHLALNHEGYDWGEFFTRQGVAAIVLKYRMPHGNHEVPLSDAEQAMRLVRQHAQEWHVNSSDVGIMGFSAGGHLASVVATQAKGDAKADFQILFYPVITMLPDYTHRATHDNFLGSDAKKKQQRQYSSDMQVSHHTPRAFILLSDDDEVVAPANGVNYYTELYRHDVPASLHVYPDGGHGYGMQVGFPYHIEMLLELKAWLSSF